MIITLWLFSGVRKTTLTSLLYPNFLVVLRMDQPMKRLSARVEMRSRAGLMREEHLVVQYLLLDPGYWLSSSPVHCHANSARRTTVYHPILGRDIISTRSSFTSCVVFSALTKSSRAPTAYRMRER